MDIVLVKKLIDRYPLVFREIKEQAEHEWRWRLDCGNGWFDLVDQACTGIEAECLYAMEIRKAPVGNVPHLKGVTQKFWQLRFRVGMSTEHSRRVVEIARKESSFVCEHCGAPTLHHQTRWTTLCDWCRRVGGSSVRGQ
jgi:hypothetical protein